MTRTLAVIFALSLTCPALLQAQPADKTAHWGIIGSVTPRWTAASQVGDHVDADQYDISGWEFAVGFVRGTSLGGDWGVSLVRKSVKEGSASRFGTSSVCYLGDCVEYSTTFTAKNVSLLGVEAHKYFNFATFRRRVQVGLNIAAGVVFVQGRADKTVRYGTFVTDPSTGSQHLTQAADVSDVPGGQIFSGGNEVHNMVSAKVEGVVGFILTRDLKLRVGGGIDFPGYHVVSVKVIYLFGRRQSLFG